jgi:polyribonucleotide nucleotidyltransferase
VLTIVTLGTPGDAQTLDTLSAEESKRYMHHYNFPPYSTGEVYPMRGPKRREIGHGALAERALEPMIPAQETFPYTLRLVSEALESNGSTSMASVCGSTLALMDAGVPVKAPVAGIAMGLVTGGDASSEGLRYAVLSDIQGLEDHLGDMDFKVAGTEHGITALQMDIKIHGLTNQIMEEALAQALEGRLFILGKMLAALPAPRKSLSPHAPRILTIHIDPEKIGKLIGPGGKNIKKIQEETKAQIDIEDDGTVYISSVDASAAERARDLVDAITAEVKIGKIYVGKVVSIREFGAFIEIAPETDGLCHVSELSDRYVENVEDVIKLGDSVRVKVILIDDQDRIKLSRKAAMKEEGVSDPAPPQGSSSGGEGSGEKERGSSPSGGRSGGRPGGEHGGHGGGDRDRRPRGRSGGGR